jgi:NAD(P)-dependent dehydrogenase (short-subunit alcohol dehydrogenase family)
MEHGFHGKRALVTGSSSGIGFEAALMLAQAGVAHVVLNGRKAERGESAARAIKERAPGAKLSFVAADVSTAAGACSLIEAGAKHLGGAIDILVTCAGGDHNPRLFRDYSSEQIESVVRHWLLSTLYCCHYALPFMPQGSAIVNVASDAAKVPTPGESVIGAAMAAIAMFSRTFAMEAKRQKIRVNVVTPSLVQNTLTHDRLMADRFSGKLFQKAIERAHLGVPEPADVAALILFLLGSQSAKLTGQVISVNGGISAG